MEALRISADRSRERARSTLRGDSRRGDSTLLSSSSSPFGDGKMFTIVSSDARRKSRGDLGELVDGPAGLQ